MFSFFFICLIQIYKWWSLFKLSLWDNFAKPKHFKLSNSFLKSVSLNNLLLCYVHVMQLQCSWNQPAWGCECEAPHNKTTEHHMTASQSIWNVANGYRDLQTVHGLLLIRCDHTRIITTTHSEKDQVHRMGSSCVHTVFCSWIPGLEGHTAGVDPWHPDVWLQN